MSEIKFEQLRDCQQMLVNLHYPMAEDKQLLRDIKNLVADARIHGYCDYRYELAELVKCEHCLGAKLIKDRYFPAEAYNPARE